MSTSSHPLVVKYIDNLHSSHVSIGWGYRPSGIRAKNSGENYLLFEDSPVRSLKPGYGGAVYGITIDTKGAMFDASGESDLIDALQHEIVVASNSSQLLDLYLASGSSKYNWSLPLDIRDFEIGVLLIDQTRGDASLEYSGITEDSFSELFDDALRENPAGPIYIKTHPDHKFRNKKSCFTEEQLRHPRVTIIPSELAPSDCFKICTKVYVASSLMGMEALIHDKEVITYGWNFYAGWGLTDDRNNTVTPPRERQHSLLELFQAAYIDYSHYYHPDTGDECSLFEILNHIQLQKHQWSLFKGRLVSLDANSWKRYLMEKYIRGPQTELRHLSSQSPILNDDKVLLWGMQKAPANVEASRIIRIEDGFIRSNGLGAKLTFPLSWVFDDVGIYFDATEPSRLEVNLQTNQYSEEQLSDADELRVFLCENKLTKYNLGIQEVTLPRASAGKRVILVPGQVDSDASIEFGSPRLKNNKELLEEIRRQHPEAFICYKPHPDLLSGARADKPLWPGIEDQVDFLVQEGDIISWIEAVDEVHTLTSTVGFEALIREKSVYTYGLPFYAGWGLTNDWLSCERRTAKRALSEIVYATLIEYPTYLNPKTGEYTTALNAAKLLADPNFTFDTRPQYIKIVGFLKSRFNKIFRQ